MQTSRSETAGKTQLTYVFDAYCGWCFGFGPALTEFVRQNADSVDLSVVSGGLFTGERVAPMSSAPYLKSANATIAAQTGAVFGDGYSQLVTDGRFVMDSTDAAIGLAALRAQDPTRALDIAEAMQIAFYRDGRSFPIPRHTDPSRNPSNSTHLPRCLPCSPPPRRMPPALISSEHAARRHFVSDAVVPRERRVRREIRFSDQYRGRSHPRPEHVCAGVCGGLTHPPCE